MRSDDKGNEKDGSKTKKKCVRNKKKNKADDGELSKVGKQEKFQEIGEDIHLEVAAVHLAIMVKCHWHLVKV